MKYDWQLLRDFPIGSDKICWLYIENTHFYQQ